MKKKGVIISIILVLILSIGVIKKVSNPGIIKANSKDAFKGFNFKKVKKINYGNYNLEDYVKEEVSCDEDACTFQDFQIEYEFTEHNNLGKQKVELKLHYKDKDYSKTFDIDVVDTEKPYINLSSDDIQVKHKSKFNIYDYIIEVYDNYDTDLKEKLVIENPVDTNVLGDYVVKLSVQDSSGNKAETKMKVKVVEDLKKEYPTKDNTDKKSQADTKIPPCSHDLLEENFNLKDINIKIWSSPYLTINKNIKSVDKDINDKGSLYLFKDTVLNIRAKVIKDAAIDVNILTPNNELIKLHLNNKGYTKYIINEIGVYNISISYKKGEEVFNYNYELSVLDEEKLSFLSYKLQEMKKLQTIKFMFNEGISHLNYDVYIYETNDEKIELIDGKYELKVVKNTASFIYEEGKYYKIKAIVTDKYNNSKSLDFKIEK